MNLGNIGKILGMSAPRSKFRDTQASALAGTQSLTPQYQQLGTQADSLAGQFRPQQAQTGQALLKRLNRGYDGAGLEKKRMLTGLGSGFDAASAQVQNNAARTGGDSAAQLANLAAKRAMATSQALSQYGQKKIDMDTEYLRDAAGVANSYANQGLGQQYQALGAQQGLYGNIAGQAGGLAQADEAQQNASRMGGANLLGTLASLYGGSLKAPRLGGNSLPDGGGVALPSGGGYPTAQPALGMEYGNGANYSMIGSPGVSTSSSGGVNDIILRRLMGGRLL